MSTDQAIQVTATIGGRKLLTSGVIHLSGQDQIDFAVTNLRFVIQFKSDEGESRYNGEVKDDALHIYLFNHKSSLGEGILEPIDIASVNGKQLSFTYFTSLVDAKESKRRFEYAFYLGGEK